MKQLLILSGKGGTGKTTIAGAFIKLSEVKAYADCDVDAPNLHLITNQIDDVQNKDYYGFPKAIIDASLCIGCGVCQKYCHFDAIKKNDKYYVDNFACEGCGVCELICKSKAISMNDAIAGELMLYESDAVFSTAQLKMGSGTSGKLVTEVKKQMKTNAGSAKFAIIDGSPGIGCPVIASISGVDMVLIVAEPSVSGISDMKRIVKTAQNFGTKIVVCINKYDTNIEKTNQIEEYCKKEKLSFVGKIPYDINAVKAINSGKSIIEFDCPSGRAVREVYESTKKIMWQV